VAAQFAKAARWVFLFTWSRLLHTALPWMWTGMHRRSWGCSLALACLLVMLSCARIDDDLAVARRGWLHVVLEML
jgi:hypothetical protein